MKKVKHHLFEVPADFPIWSIGIYRGRSPFHLNSHGQPNPILTHHDVSDVPAIFVADPFIVSVDDQWHLFFEVLNGWSGKGQIGHAVSKDGGNWAYQQIVLSESFHLSYPYVFEWKGDYYMIPESHEAEAVRLYKASRFPSEWTFIATLLQGPYFADSSILRHEDRWWLFVDASPTMRHDTLRLYYANELTGPWLEHPKSPIIKGDASNARPAGRVLAHNGKIFRFAQNSLPFYGTDVRAFEITEMTAQTYQEQGLKQCILGPSGSGWNACGMHHIDAHLLKDGSWLASVDGWNINE